VLLKKKYIAFFDLDHTILNTSSGKIISLAAVRHGIISRSKFLEGVFFAIGNKLGLVKGDTALPRMTQWLKDRPEQHIVEFARQIFNEVIKNTIRKEAVREIEFHRKNNARLVLLSASLSFICRPVIDFLRLDDLICTNMQVENNRFSGRPQGDICFGQEKLTRAMAFAKNRHSELRSAYFYSDSHTDLPMLEAVGHPMCVTPDRKLEATAKERGWLICNW
jgi:HAD superfamily hydrolase (TIGR01490 family)